MNFWIILFASVFPVVAACDATGETLRTPLPVPPKISVRAITDSASVDKYAGALEAWYRNTLSGRVATLAEKEAAILGQRYRTAIEGELRRFQSAGNLDGVLACKNELAGLAAGGPPSPLDQKAPEGLRSLRRKYETGIQSILTRKSNQIEELKKRLLAAMKSMEIDLTRAGRTELAVQLRGKTEQMVKDGVASKTVFLLTESWKNTTPEGALIGSPESHEIAIDANDHRGQGQLVFPANLSKLDRGLIEGIWLQLTVSSNPYAGSSSPVQIWQGKKLVGQHQGLGRHWSPRIPLDLSVLSLEKSIVLDLRMAGNDGAMFWSPKSGTPPKLEIEWK